MAPALFKLSSDGGSNYLAAGTAMADANALAYVASGSYSMKAALDSTAGVDAIVWTITSADDAHNASLPTVTTNADKTCTFTVPKTGGAWLLQCRVNGGVNAQTGAADTSMLKRLAIKVLNANGKQEIAVGEVDEAGTNGWTKAINDVGRAVVSVDVGTGWLYGLGADGARTDSGGGAGTPLATQVDHTDWTLSNTTSVRLAGYFARVRGTLTLGAGCALHNEGNDGAANSTTAGASTGIAGSMAASIGAGGVGGSAGAVGNAPSGQSTAYGGAGGTGGTSATSKAGGAGGTVTPPVLLSIGPFRPDLMAFLVSNSFTKAAAGTGGGGGGGGSGVVGSGGGSSGGLLWLAAQTIVLGAGARISANGGAGGANSLGGGGGGGGGGGLLVVFADDITLPGGSTYADCFKAAGGAGGVGSGGGASGSAGSAGRVFVYLQGRLVYASP